MAALGDLRTEVRRTTSIRESNKKLLEGLAAKIEELKQQPAELQSLADELRADNDGITADVAANTPAPPPA